jgi:hypothetical protein
MAPAKAQRGIADLRTQVGRHNELHQGRAKPELSDFGYHTGGTSRSDSAPRNSLRR